MRLRSAPRRLARLAGRRGAFLSFLALLDFGYGYSLLTTPDMQRVLDLMLPWTAWGYTWIGIGTVMASGVFVRKDRVQFAVSAAFKTAWAMVYVKLWLVQGMPRAWVAVVIWLAFAAIVLVVSGWPEVPAGLLPAGEPGHVG